MKLGPGQYFGRTQRTWKRHGLMVTVSRYQAGHEVPWHVHEHPGLFLVLQGHHRDQSRRSSHDLNELTVVFHPTTEVHAGATGPGDSVGLNLEFDPAWLECHELRPADLGGYRVLDSVPSRLAVLTLLGVLGRADDLVAADGQSHAFELLEPLIHLPAPTESIAPAWLRRTEGFMRAAFRFPISLRDCARESNVHPVHLARVFRRHFRCSVSNYLRALRLVEASRLVLCEGLTITRAAHRAGFADQAHFTRTCSRSLGFSPGALRRAKEALRM